MIGAVSYIYFCLTFCQETKDTMNYLVFFVTSFFLNIPFGFFRNPLSDKAESRSLRFLIKLLMIHAPIPLVIVLRHITGVERTIPNLVISICVCISGQILGSRVLPKFIPCRESL